MDWESYAFKKNAISANSWTAPIDGVNVKVTQISSHQGEIELDWHFLRILKCKLKTSIFVTTLTEIPEYREVIITIQMNLPARLHPKSGSVLRTVGIRLHHAITNPQIVDPNIPNEEYHRILREIRPSVWRAYVENPKE